MISDHARRCFRRIASGASYLLILLASSPLIAGPIYQYTYKSNRFEPDNPELTANFLTLTIRSPTRLIGSGSSQAGNVGLSVYGNAGEFAASYPVPPPTYECIRPPFTEAPPWIDVPCEYFPVYPYSRAYAEVDFFSLDENGLPTSWNVSVSEIGYADWRAFGGTLLGTIGDLDVRGGFDILAGVGRSGVIPIMSVDNNPGQWSLAITDIDTPPTASLVALGLLCLAWRQNRIRKG